MQYVIFRLRRQYNKNSKHWTVVEEREPKTYPHIPRLIDSIVQEKLDCKLSIDRPRELSAQDPKSIKANIAAVELLPTEDIFKSQRSRFPKVE